MAPTRVIRPVKRARWLYACVVAVLVIFGLRIFYLQVIQHEHYRLAALADQFKEYQIAPTRGLIKAHDGQVIVPIVLNQRLYTLYADPTLIKDVDKAAETLAAALGGKTGDFIDKLETEDTRYVVLAKKVTEEQKEQILKHKYPGIGAQDQYYRIYPNGSLASQLLGFVNNDGQGTYGVEEALDEELTGTPGQLKAVTDVHGVPLAANRDNVLIAPEAGKDVVLTIDLAMQKQLETILKNGLDKAKSGSGSALIMDPRDGSIKAMANYPTYDPSDYASADDSLFSNKASSDSLEVGSIMKPLTAAAALNLGVIKPDATYYDPAEWAIDDYKITNIEEDGGAARRSVQEILSMSLNTGATWFLMQMSEQGKTEITKSGRERWHDYMVNHYRFGQPTGIEQGYEDPGYIPDPNEGYGLNLTYANTAFGQGMRATPLQMAAAFSAIINGGTYYQPRLVDMTVDAEGKSDVKAPIVRGQNVVSQAVSADMRRLLQGVVASKTYIRPAFNLSQYSVGGKTGTAEIAKPGGGYFEHEFNGTYLGFVGGDMPQYVVAIRVNQPKIGGYAGTAAAQPIFVELAHMLIDDFGVTPKGHN